MTVTFSLRRFPLPVLLILVLVGCATTVTTTAPAGAGTRAAQSTVSAAQTMQSTMTCKGNPGLRSYAPIVCIDDTSAELTWLPEPVHAANHQKPESGGGPVIMNFFTVSGGSDLTIMPHASGEGRNCFRALQCAGGHCLAIVNEDAIAPGKETAECKYDIRAGGKIKDPIVIVDTCCPPN